MLPNFYQWLEQADVEDMPSGVSEPQHKTGENNLPLNKLIEKRMKEMIEELTSKGTATEDDILSSIGNYLNKNSNQQQTSDQNQPSSDPNQQPLDQNQPLSDPNQQPSDQNPNQLGLGQN
jgi:hypothetical protein